MHQHNIGATIKNLQDHIIAFAVSWSIKTINLDSLEPHFHKVKLDFAGVYIISSFMHFGCEWMKFYVE